MEQRDQNGISALQLVFLQNNEWIIKTVRKYCYSDEEFNKIKKCFTKDKMRKFVNSLIWQKLFLKLINEEDYSKKLFSSTQTEDS